MRDKRRPRAHARRSMRRFASGVTAADNDDIEGLHGGVLRADSNRRQNVSRESIAALSDRKCFT
jgi:hypothetical protein